MRPQFSICITSVECLSDRLSDYQSPKLDGLANIASAGRDSLLLFWDGSKGKAVSKRSAEVIPLDSNKLRSLRTPFGFGAVKANSAILPIQPIACSAYERSPGVARRILL